MKAGKMNRRHKDRKDGRSKTEDGFKDRTRRAGNAPKPSGNPGMMIGPRTATSKPRHGEQVGWRLGSGVPTPLSGICTFRATDCDGVLSGPLGSELTHASKRIQEGKQCAPDLRARLLFCNIVRSSSQCSQYWVGVITPLIDKHTVVSNLTNVVTNYTYLPNEEFPRLQINQRRKPCHQQKQKRNCIPRRPNRECCVGTDRANNGMGPASIECRAVRAGKPRHLRRDG